MLDLLLELEMFGVFLICAIKTEAVGHKISNSLISVSMVNWVILPFILRVSVFVIKPIFHI